MDDKSLVISEQGKVVSSSFVGVDDIPIFYTDDELRRFFLSISLSKSQKKHRDFVFFMTLLCTGKRVSEVLLLKRNDIDFDKKIVRFVTLKKRKRRIMYLRLHRDLAVPLAVFVGGMKAEQKVFEFTRQHADYLIKKYGKLANIKNKRVSCHIFRHTFSVLWLESGGDLYKLSKWLDHSNVGQTTSYLRISNKSLFDVADNINFRDILKDENS